MTRHFPLLKTAAVSFLFLTIATVAAAEQVRVVRDGATIWRRANGTGGVLTVARAGTILEVEGRDGRWLIVHLLGAPDQRGYILAQQTEAVAPEDEVAPPRPSVPPRVQPRRPVAARRQPRESFLSVGLLLQPGSSGFVAVTTVPTYLEDEIRTTTYDAPRRPGFEIGGGTWVTPQVSVGLLLTRRQFSESAQISAQIPHPFYYNQPRTLTGQSSADRADTALHVQVGFMAYSGKRLKVIVAGGPSFVWVEQGLLDQLSYNDSFPFDTVTFTSATMSTETAHGFGGNVDATALVPVSRSAAIAVSGRYVFENVSFATAGVPEVKGAGQVSVGVRLRF